MLTTPNFVVAANYRDIYSLQGHLDSGGIVVVETYNKMFTTRILDSGKRLRVTNLGLSLDNDKHYDIEIGKGPRSFARVKTQVTNRFGQVLKFEGYYLQYALTPTDLRDEIMKHLPNA